MKQRFSSHMTLIELTSALFFLMLAMATIMGLFTTAYDMSGEAKRLTRAVQLAQNCAALIEGCEDPAAMLAESEYEEAGHYAWMYNESGDLTASVELELKQTEVGKLYDGMIHVLFKDEVLIDWPVACYIL